MAAKQDKPPKETPTRSGAIKLLTYIVSKLIPLRFYFQGSSGRTIEWHSEAHLLTTPQRGDWVKVYGNEFDLEGRVEDVSYTFDVRSVADRSQRVSKRLLIREHVREEKKIDIGI